MGRRIDDGTRIGPRARSLKSLDKDDGRLGELVGPGYGSRQFGVCATPVPGWRRLYQCQNESAIFSEALTDVVIGKVYLYPVSKVSKVLTFT